VGWSSSVEAKVANIQIAPVPKSSTFIERLHNVLLQSIKIHSFPRHADT
jgi:hypothetical protein